MKTRTRTLTTIGTFALLGGATLFSFYLPWDLSVPMMMASPSSPPPSSITLNTLVRDFRESHPDFQVTASVGNGHYAGNVGTALGPRQRPVLVDGVEEFTISGGAVVPGEPFAARATVVSTSLGEDGTPPITMMVHADAQDIEPFGPFDYDANQSGSINDGNNPREHIFPLDTIYEPGTTLDISATAWQFVSSGSSDAADRWVPRRSPVVRAGSGSPYVFVLQKGDPVPAPVAGAPFMAPYVDSGTDTIDIEDYQALYLFELSSNPSPGDYDDLVVLVTLASDPSFFAPGGSSDPVLTASGFKVLAQWTDSGGNNIAPHLYVPIGTDEAGDPIADAPGMVGPVGDGGTSTEESFDQWFADHMLVNMSTSHPITLWRNTAGVYEYLDNDFHPIDGLLLGNEGRRHNHHFTMAFSASFTYDVTADQFIEIQGGDGAWLFVQEKLVMDLGGVRTSANQYLALDRLGLMDGQTYQVHFFYAQRHRLTSVFRFRTNVELTGGQILGSVTKPFD
ncbi:MAG: fibro-slime domain-containing protein [Planctomycetota bacterium]|jgi:fibro-slime domain-containing protein